MVTKDEALRTLARRDQMKSGTCSPVSWGIGRAVTKISICRVNTTSRQGIKQLGICFGSIFFYFPIKVARGHVLSSRGKSSAPTS